MSIISISYKWWFFHPIIIFTNIYKLSVTYISTYGPEKHEFVARKQTCELVNESDKLLKLNWTLILVVTLLLLLL